MIRAFVGLGLTEDVVIRLAAVQAGLPVGRAVAPESLHVTLAFLDSQPEPVLEDLHHALAEIAAPALTLEIDGLGMFGGEKPRSLHALIRPDPTLAALRKRVLTAARVAGIRPEGGRFVPHVTLARFSRPPQGEDRLRLEAFVAERAAVRAGPFRVGGFALFRSHLGREGAIYEALAEYPLG